MTAAIGVESISECTVGAIAVSFEGEEEPMYTIAALRFLKELSKKATAFDGIVMTNTANNITIIVINAGVIILFMSLYHFPYIIKKKEGIIVFRLSSVHESRHLDFVVYEHWHMSLRLSSHLRRVSFFLFI